MALVTGTLLFVGCAEKEIKKDAVANVPVASNDVYDVVVNKSIKDCQEYDITLNKERTNDFMRRSPKKTIEQAAQQEAKTPQKLCEFFAEETSPEKIEQVELFSNKIIKGCANAGVTLSETGIRSKILSLPFFVIKKGLASNDQTSLKECQLMEKKYK
ncbi:MAG: Unknown protein [uncultured Sulfurovum sp.]|uniref:Uncharacterized protein n=1 Tax=uncultured Sulfurovum sp. TaxID=269237 RepID=A0A6S6T2T5_9BACT|nr:MAG: Unknown protein [uncultured Sulfurovum sp.]